MSNDRMVRVVVAGVIPEEVTTLPILMAKTQSVFVVELLTVYVADK